MALRGAPRARRDRIREASTGYLFIAPWMVGFAVSLLDPMLASPYLSFSRYNPSEVRKHIRWVGPENYVRLLIDDPVFWKSLLVTFRYSSRSIPRQPVGGLALARLLDRKIRGMAVYRATFYLPVVLAGVAR